MSYSFIGRHWEGLDAGYSCYSGFLHMEAMHTNPIIICFCSILYYKGLTEHLHRYKKQRRALMLNGELESGMRVEMRDFTGRLSISPIKLDEPSGHSHLDGDGQNENATSRIKLMKRTYKTQVLIRWHLFLRMTLNKEIIKYRRVNLRKRDKQPPLQEGVLSKIKKRILGIFQKPNEVIKI